MSEPDQQKLWLKEQKREDVIEEIVYNSKKTNLTHLRRIGWTNGFPDRFRSPSWQLLLHYLPQSKTKRESTLRRKRIEYHRHITKHYFEFDFCLTDRKLASVPTSSPSPHTLSPPSSQQRAKRKSITSQLQKMQSDSLFQASLMPLFSQPSPPPTKEQIKMSTTREDSLLLQIRHDINNMVKIPTRSSLSSSSFRNAKKAQQRKQHLPQSGLLNKIRKTLGRQPQQQQQKSQQQRKIPTKKSNDSNNKHSFPTHYEDDLHGENTTTTNRLFANPVVKGSLERILYLWSIRIKKQKHHNDHENGRHKKRNTTKMFSNTSSTSRYIPGMVDIVYPLYLIILHGYVWDTHTSTILDNDNTDDDNDDNNGGSFERDEGNDNFLTKLGKKIEEENDDDDDDEDDDKEDEKKLDSTQNRHHHQSDVLENESRMAKIKFCHELRIGKGIDRIPEEILDEIEADTFWCLENMMNAIQDYRYNDAFFPKKSSSSNKKFKLNSSDGLQKMIILTEKVIQRVDPVLHTHLKSKGVEFQWFVFRWMNTLQVRTMNEKCIIRLWDTCLCEEIDKSNKGGTLGLNYFTTFGFNPKRSKKRLHLSGFLSFQVYICAALIHQIRDKILSQSKFQDILYRLRNLTLSSWGVEDITLLLSQAFVWKETFCNTENQLMASATEEYGDDTISTWVKKSHWPPRKETSRPVDSVESITNILHNVEGNVLAL